MVKKGMVIFVSLGCCEDLSKIMSSGPFRWEVVRKGFFQSHFLPP